MAVGFSIKIEGRAALEKAFNELPLKIQKQILRPALRAGAKVMRTSVQAVAPVSDTAPHVRDTLKIKAMKRDRSAKGRIGLVIITAKRAVLGIRDFTEAEKSELDRRRAVREGLRAGAKASGTKYVAPAFGKKRIGPGYYPAHIEYGYMRGGVHVPANPWMKRGLEQGRQAATDAVANEIERRMRTAAGLDGKSTAGDQFLDDTGEVF